MNLLLDTHVLLWLLHDSPKLGRRARARINDAHASVWVSAASVWEIAIKASTGRLKLSEQTARSLRSAIANANLETLAVDLEHASAVYDLPRHHPDPFDRLLIAQAMIEGLIIVTADDVFAEYAVRTLAAQD